MTDSLPATSPTTHGAHMVVTQLDDGRYSVTFTSHGISRRSYAHSLDQVIRQAQHAGGVPIHTDDSVLRQRCQELQLPLV